MSPLTIASKPLTFPKGFGLMGLTLRANPPPTSQAFETMRTSLENGANFWNGGEFYGPTEYNSLVLLNRYFKKHPEDQDKVVLSVKGGTRPGQLIPDGSDAGVRRSVDDCLKQLQGDGVSKTIDVFECARVDPNVPVEETISTLAALVAEGKIGGIGLSEVSANTIRRAAKVHPIAAVEVEMSLFATDILRNGVAMACAELDIPIVAYSPLGRGALTNKRVRSNAELDDSDHNKHMPKFQDAVLESNNRLLDAISAFASKKGVTEPQIALAWVRGYSRRTITLDGKTVTLGDIIPIPGATTKARVQENMKTDIELSDDELKELDEILEKFPVLGDRYPEHTQKYSEG